MGRTFDVKQAAELMDEQFAARWRNRQAAGALSRLALRAIHARLLASGAPVPVEAVVAELAAHPPAEVRAAIDELDDRDLVALHDGAVTLAYPFATAPTAFRLGLPDGRVRYAVCAVDALGVAPLLGHRVGIESRCHHCAEPLGLDVEPDGPRGGDGTMVWVGDRGELRHPAFSSR